MGDHDHGIPASGSEGRAAALHGRALPGSHSSPFREQGDPRALFEARHPFLINWERAVGRPRSIAMGRRSAKAHPKKGIQSNSFFISVVWGILGFG
ncbi:MAG: hypothetical protein Ct9H300mP8_11810 [Gammaproteobacteria bacterium]|nr:MAG: hypothetical protein Ct9H300mP8_11810 [Gammaproteobacteria bacterium]